MEFDTIPFLFFLIDGRGFAVGIGLTLFTVVLAFPDMKTGWKRIIQWISASGLLLVTISGTPMPIWIYVAWVLAVIAMLICQDSTKIKRFIETKHAGTFLMIRFITGTLCVVIFALEWPYLQSPSFTAGSRQKMYVIGDSISSGIYHGEQTWPVLLQKERRIEVANLAEPGILCRSALSQAEKIKETDAFVLLEIGGNDVLNGTPVSEYEASLESLLLNLYEKRCISVMFELPSPPFQWDYNRIQRSLARKYGVKLIPKRYFTSILSKRNNTVDGIHLSCQGHKQMADMVWTMIRNAFEIKK